MLAALAAAPEAASAGLPAAILVAAGVTALVAVGMIAATLHRGGRLAPARGVLGAALALGVVAVAATGVAALSPGSAQAGEEPGNRYVVLDEGEGPDLQLPTLGLED